MIDSDIKTNYLKTLEEIITIHNGRLGLENQTHRLDIHRDYRVSLNGRGGLAQSLTTLVVVVLYDQNGINQDILCKQQFSSKKHLSFSEQNKVLNGLARKIIFDLISAGIPNLIDIIVKLRTNDN